MNDTPPAGIPPVFNGKRFRHAWTYRDAAGAVLGHVARFDDSEGNKDVIPFFGRDGKAEGPPEPRPLFGLDKSHRADTVYIVEGEKCAAALHALDVAAVTSLGGSQAPHKSDWGPLEHVRRVFILPDNDATMRAPWWAFWPRCRVSAK